MVNSDWVGAQGGQLRLGTQRLYVLAGVVWALLLGPLATVAVVGFSAGIAWLYIFGDGSWPEAGNQIILLLGLACGFLVAASVIWIGYKFSRRTVGLADRVYERRRATALLFIPLLLILLTGFYLWSEALKFRESMRIASLREASFVELVSEIQKIDDVSITSDADEVFRARVHVSGRRNGDYRVRWKVRDSGFSRVLLTGTRNLTLHTGANDMEVSFTLEQLIHQYRSIILNGRGGVLVEETFRFEVAQEPHLTPREHAMLPPGERLSGAESPLRSERSVDFPVEFTIPP